MRKLGFCLCLLAILAFVMPAYAGIGDSLLGFNGQHYHVNIIGVSKDKKVDMTGSDRRTIFVPLDSGGDVGRQVTIEYVRNIENPTAFEVLDGNATDDNLAVIAVPYQFCEDLTAGCSDLVSFAVFAVGLGKPNGNAIVTANCEYTQKVVDPLGTEGLTCQDTLLLATFPIDRKKGSPKPVDITNIFRATGCLDLNASGMCDAGDLSFNNMWIFNIPELESYMWDYDNNGLKHMQVRFYPTNPADDWIGYTK